jgi:O-antigen ligase
MDSFALVALAVIAGIPALYLAARIWHEPFVGLWLWVALLPASVRATSLMGYSAGQGPALLQKLTLNDPLLLLTGLASISVGSGASGILRGRQAHSIVALFVGFCGVGLLSALVNDTGGRCLIDLATYSWLCLSLVIICRLVDTRLRAQQILSALGWAAVIACAASAAGTVLVLSGTVDGWLVAGGRVTGLFEEPQQVQSFMMIVTPFLCATALGTGTKIHWRLGAGVLIFLAFLSVVSSGTRAGTIFMGLSICLMVMMTSPRTGAVWMGILALIAGAAWQLVVHHGSEVPFGIRRALSIVESASYELRDLSHGRADQLETWGTVFAEHALLGVGLDQFRNGVPQLVLGGKAQEMHNSYLAVLAETGLVGGVLMLGLLGIALRRSISFLWRAWRRGSPGELDIARALLVAYIGLLLYGTIQQGLRQRHFWLVIALIVSLPQICASSRRERLAWTGYLGSSSPPRRGVRQGAS